MNLKCRDCGDNLGEYRRCERCGIIATWWNDLTGEVYSWDTIRHHEAACERMQDELDAAFCHQYFDEW